MELSPGARDRIAAKYRRIHPDLIDRIADDVLEASDREAVSAAASPFAISWMDSYLAHFELRAELAPSPRTQSDVVDLVREMIDVRFRDRLGEIRDVLGRGIVEPGGGPSEPGTPSPPAGPPPPDGGPPEPGVPPAGPTSTLEPPDGGPPEPGTPPAGPTSVFQPPDGGPPEPGTPPAGPSGIDDLTENPWILYWFVSVKAPLLIDVMDAHITRRLSELESRSG